MLYVSLAPNAVPQFRTRSPGRRSPSAPWRSPCAVPSPKTAPGRHHYPLGGAGRHPRLCALVARQDGVIAGTAIPAEVYRQSGSDVVVTEHVQDGARVHTGQDMLTLAGRAREFITGERTALNFLTTHVRH